MNSLVTPAEEGLRSKIKKGEILRNALKKLGTHGKLVLLVNSKRCSTPILTQELSGQVTAVELFTWAGGVRVCVCVGGGEIVELLLTT